MPDPLAELDRAAREWGDANRQFGKLLRADDEAFGQACVTEQRARRRYEEALEAVRAGDEELIAAARAGMDLAMRVGDGENKHSPLASKLLDALRDAERTLDVMCIALATTHPSEPLTLGASEREAYYEEARARRAAIRAALSQEAP